MTFPESLHLPAATVQNGGPCRILFVGLDSSEPLLLRQWMREGDLPCLAALAHKSHFQFQDAPRGMGNGAEWPAAFTGVSPAAHGRYYYLQFDPSTYRCYQFDDQAHFASPPFWEHASDAGRRVAVLDMVHGPLSPRLNGIQIGNWLAHNLPPPARSTPPDLIASVLSEFGGDPWNGHSDDAFRAAPNRDPAEWVSDILSRIDRKGACSAKLLTQGGWDLFATAFSDPHDMGHLLWHLHDPEHPAFDARWRERHGDPIKAVYKAIDRHVGHLVDIAGPDAHVVLYTGPGMGPSYTANLALDDILRRLESRYVTQSTRQKTKEAIRRAYKTGVPLWIRERLNVGSRVNRLSYRPDADDFDPDGLSGRLFFPVPNSDNAGAVRFNVKGREARGMVEREAVHALSDRLARDFAEIVNDETGAPLVREVFFTPRSLKGPYVDALPDMFIIWNRPNPIRAVRSPKIGRIVVPQPPLRTGDHNGHSLFLFRSSGSRPAYIDVAALDPEDIAPTMLALLDVVPPKHYEGVCRVQTSGNVYQAPAVASAF